MKSDEYCDISKITIRQLNKNVATDIINKYHYTHNCGNIKIAFGIFIENNVKFFDKGEKVIGAIIYSHPVGRNVIESISDSLKSNEVLELTRLYIHDGYGKNIESYSISKSIKLIKKLMKNIKVLISYADPEQNHVGTIYQSSNWLYQGNKFRLVDSYWYNLKGKWVHPRTIVERYGSLSPQVILKHYKEYEIKELERKHRYIYILGSKKEKKELKKKLKYPILKYPKLNNNNYDEVVYIVRKNKNGNIEMVKK